MRVLISTQCFLPIPAIKGGAVPTLIDSLIKENERNNKLHFTVITLYDSNLCEQYKKIKNTSFIFLKKNKIIDIFDSIINRLIKFVNRKEETFSKRYLWKMYVLSRTKKILLKENFDRVVFENSGFLLKSIDNKYIRSKYSNNFYYHLHNDIPLNIDKKNVKECKTIVISEYLKRNVVSLMGKEYENKIILLKNGINLETFFQELDEKEKRQLLSKLNLEGKKIITFIGRISKEKGIKELVDAFSNINDDNYTLLIIGSHNFAMKDKSEFEKEINNRIKKMKDRVVFTGYIKHDDVWKYYKISDIVVLPSIWEEPAGLTMLEAAAADRPLITTKSGGIPEYISNCDVEFINNDSNIVNNLEKSIVSLINRNKNIDNREFVQEYSEENFYKRFVDIMDK